MHPKAWTTDPIQPFWVLDSVRYLKKTSRMPAIAHFYKFEASPGITSSCAVPDGAIDIVMECGGETLNARVCGPVSHSKAPGFERGKTYFGIRLLPESLSHVGEASIAELAGNEYVLNDMMHDASFLERVYQEKDFGQQALIFEEGLAQNVDEALPHDSAHHLTLAIIDEIYQCHGTERVSDLESKLGYSRRHLTRCFTATMGMDIKTFSRHVRFQYVLHGIRDGRYSSVADAAMAASYCDQSHLQKDFHAFTNTTPYGMMRLFEESDYAHRITLCT